LKLSITTMAGSTRSTRSTIAARVSSGCWVRITEPRSTKPSRSPIASSSKKVNCCM